MEPPDSAEIDVQPAVPPPSQVIQTVEISGKTIWQAIGAIVATIVLIMMIMKARNLVGMLAISFFFSLALQPAVNRLHARRGWRRGSAVGVVYLAGGVFMVFLIAILIPAIVTIATTIGDNFAPWMNNLNGWLTDTFGWQGVAPDRASEIAAEIDDNLAMWASNVFGTVLNIAASGIGLIFSLATIAMFTFYFTADAPRLQRAFLALFDDKTQMRIGWAWDEAVKQTGGYFYSRIILMMINGTGFFFTMVLVGVPTVLAIGLAIFGSFVSAFIPAVGTYIGGAVPIIMTLAVQDLVAALVLLGYVLVYQQVENYWLSPKI
ncbi:MAG: AI-2E family transporter, partial [Acidimicrobiia bacterium]|nr:AI-2E family transporter [Acidimicrobiia bacterium]